MSDEEEKEKLLQEIESGAKLKKAKIEERPTTDLSAEKALLEKLRAEGKLEEEED